MANVWEMDSCPNIYVLLKILGTVAIALCECERSGSALKKFKYLSSGINGSNPFKCIIHINLDVDIDAKRVLKIYCQRDKALEFTKHFCVKSSII